MKQNMTKTALLFLFFIVVFSQFAVSQTESIRTVSVTWNKPETTELNGITFTMPNFDDMATDAGRLLRTYQEEIKSGMNVKVALKAFETEPALSEEIDYIKRFNVPVDQELYYLSKSTNGFGSRYLNVVFSPFILVNGSVHRVKNVDFSVIPDLVAFSNVNKSFVTQSVLRQGSGSWYKISVTQDGIYKIDKNFLASMGINVNGLNPRHIHIYGNGDGRIPDRNDSPLRTDDLAQIAIQVVEDGNQVFDGGDYILFYAKGPHRWDLDFRRFFNVRHIYSDVSTYFININSNVTQNRIQQGANITQAVTHPVNSYDYYAIIEQDVYNLTNSGQRWYGDKFDVELSKNYNIPVPNPVVGHPSKLQVIVASNARSTSSGSFSYFINGQNVLTSGLPSAGGAAGIHNNDFDFNNVNNQVSARIVMTRNDPATEGYLDKIDLQTRRYLQMMNGQFGFRDLISVGAGNVSEFSVGGIGNGFVWEVTNRQQPVVMQTTINGGTATFKSETSVLKEFIASDGVTFLSPTFVGQVMNQDLHSLPAVDYVIITNGTLVSQANRLAELHRNTYNRRVEVVLVDQIYNEFASGMKDAAGIRQFIKMLYDKGRNGQGPTLKYVALFGDGIFDPKGRKTGKVDVVPSFQSPGASFKEDPISNIGTDDYYGMLDDNEGFTSVDVIDVAIGRILGSELHTLKEQVNKIEHYMKNGSSFFTQNNVNCIDGVSSTTFGDWRSKIVNVADFEDYFIVRDLEPAYDILKVSNPELNVKKLYLDAYQMETSVSGERFPQLNQDLINSFYSGSLIINYVGHGGVDKLSNSTIINKGQIQELKNADRLPLFVSSTCEFTRYDDPSQISAGEWMALNPIGGGIGLLTTTRTVSYTLNTMVINALFTSAFGRNTDFKPYTLGEMLLETKKSLGIGGSTDKSAFILVGDPGLRLAIPEYKVVIDSVNGKAIGQVTDTIRALSKATVKGHIEDFQGNILNGFKGVAATSLYDKVKGKQTLGQKPGNGIIGYANVIPYEDRNNIIYRGQSTVTNGYFSMEFIVPKDIDYNYGFGKFSSYANSTGEDAIGQDQRVYIGGINPNGLDDSDGPEIRVFMNNQNFVSGGLTDENPYLIAKIFDQSGINTVGNGIGHDITLVLDGAADKPIILNDYYKNSIDSYKDGELRYQLNKLKPGKHTLSLKVWDVNNNSTEETIEFIVQEQSELALKHVLNYPNPFTTHTEFFFEHNQCCTNLDVQVQIFTVSGKVVKTINKQVYTQGYRSEGIVWDGLDDFGDRLARGVYVYRLKVRTPEGEIADKIEKLVLL